MSEYWRRYNNWNAIKEDEAKYVLDALLASFRMKRNHGRPVISAQSKGRGILRDLDEHYCPEHLVCAEEASEYENIRDFILTRDDDSATTLLILRHQCMEEIIWKAEGLIKKRLPGVMVTMVRLTVLTMLLETMENAREEFTQYIAEGEK